MTPYDEVFARLSIGNDTCKLARTLHSQASLLTKHGSGRSLGQGHNALPAICAFLASQRLGNGDVTRDQARAAACVDRKTFESALSSVERILPDQQHSRNNQETITYRSLSKEYVAREDAYVPMVEVEDALQGCEALANGSPIDLKSSLMQCAIFYWVCTAILQVTIPDATYFRQKLHVSPQTWSAPQRLLERHCSHLMGDLIQKADIALSARKTRSQTRPKISAGVESSLTKPATTGKLSVHRTHVTSPLDYLTKRKMPLDRQLVEDGHSPKRSKISVHALPGIKGERILTPKKVTRLKTVSFSFTPQSAKQITDDEENDEVLTEAIVVRSIPHKRPDRCPLDFPSPTSHVGSASYPAIPSAQIRRQVINIGCTSTPLSSTGISDTSSPSTPSCPSAHKETNVHPLVAGKTQMPVPLIQVEELSRRRRRNLRAAFLDPGVYAWRPTGLTAYKLRRAHKWEVLMTSKYGDPWDAW